jgi:hypothetical protein
LPHPVIPIFQVSPIFPFTPVGNCTHEHLDDNESQESRFGNFNRKNIRIQFVNRTGHASTTLYTHPGAFATPLGSLCNDYDKRRSSDSCCGLDLLGFGRERRRAEAFLGNSADGMMGVGGS